MPKTVRNTPKCIFSKKWCGVKVNRPLLRQIQRLPGNAYGSTVEILLAADLFKGAGTLATSEIFQSALGYDFLFSENACLSTTIQSGERVRLPGGPTGQAAREWLAVCEGHWRTTVSKHPREPPDRDGCRSQLQQPLESHSVSHVMSLDVCLRNMIIHKATHPLFKHFTERDVWKQPFSIPTALAFDVVLCIRPTRNRLKNYNVCQCRKA